MVLESPPTMFGPFHLGWLVVILLFNALAYLFFRSKSEAALIKTIHILGIIMLVAEIWKQWYVYTHIYVEEFSLWFFPWQLCSMAMYCSFLLPYLKGKVQDAVLVFLATFSLFAAVVVLIIPSDMLRPQLIFASHGFLYHGIMVMESILAILIMKKRKNIVFFPSVILFLLMAAVAEIINVVGFSITKDIHTAPNMFYITPYDETTQVGLNYIAKQLGIFPEIAIYLSGIILISYLIYLLISRIRQPKQAE